MTSSDQLISNYIDFLQQRGFPCIAAKAAVAKGHIHCFVAYDIRCEQDDKPIHEFLLAFVDGYRRSAQQFHSAAIIFQHPDSLDDHEFDTYFWKRLSLLNHIDKQLHVPDPRVKNDPRSPHFSFSIGSEAFFVIGLHPRSCRKARRFDYPTIVFNPHAEFEKLRDSGRYQSMKETVRKRDANFSGSVNPLLTDFGDESEVHQYSGVRHSPDWTCPL